MCLKNRLDTSIDKTIKIDKCDVDIENAADITSYCDVVHVLALVRK
jgi:hypothetical protein